MAGHLRSTAALTRNFTAPFGAGDLGAALGLLHDAGKADCGWQDRLRGADGTGNRVGGDHKSLGARLLLDAAGPAALAVLGHHGGLGALEDLRGFVAKDLDPADRATADRLLAELPEARPIIDGEPLIPEAWRRDPLVLEMGLRLAFSALVDADHLDTGAHFAGLAGPQVAPPADMATLLRRFEHRRAALLADRPASPVDGVRAELYAAAVAAAAGPPGLYRLPAPTGSGKTMTAAAFALHHAVRYGQSRVIVAVPFVTITEQNAQVYRELLGAENVVEHHSAVEQDGDRARLGAENWDAPFVVTTTVQLFDSLFGRKPARSRKLHRLANAVIVLDEVQALPAQLLVPILDGLRLLTEHFGTTVLLASATQPAFQHLQVWQQMRITDVVDQPAAVYDRLRRVRYEWWLDPQPTLAEVADRVASQRQALVVVNTVRDARELAGLLNERGGAVRHLSTRMCPAHRRAVLAEVQDRLAADEPVLLVSTQLIEAGVDVDFPAVYRALAPADSLQQAAGRANREGRRAEPGRVVVFDAADAGAPPSYRTPVGVTSICFGPGRADPDDLIVLEDYYRRLYEAMGTDRGQRATTIQRNRRGLDFAAVADGPWIEAGESGARNPRLAFRMLDDETVPVVVTGYDGDGEAARLLAELRATDGARRDLFRALQRFTVAMPERLMARPDVAALSAPVVGDLREWLGDYHPQHGIDEDEIAKEMVW
ncbi:CRISPR-associated helicase Cas3' [Pseudonocardia sp. T1-2H]|uniref:CRISPR-associated helicase Cas3' n=1 Tax=Pseudonocardia sp. T1-2H TaxID=3128899 RepID=UPI0031018162